MIEIDRQEFKEYCLFISLAITGFSREADAMINDKDGKKSILSVAKSLSDGLKESGVQLPRLYRGIIVEQNSLEPGGLTRDMKQPFLSFSEDIDVACYFASSKSFLSEVVVSQLRKPAGYIASYDPEFSDIIFCYRYMSFIGEIIKLSGMAPSANIFFQEMFARISPLNKDPSMFNQFAWNLQSQKEFILKNRNSKYKYRPIKKFNCKPQQQLDEKLHHPLMTW